MASTVTLWKLLSRKVSSRREGVAARQGALTEMSFRLTGRIWLSSSVLATVSLLASWNANSASMPITALMVDVVNPAANILWSSRDKDTLSDNDWSEITRALATLGAAGATISNEHNQAKSAEWQEWSMKFMTTVQAAKHANESKDKQALTRAGRMLVDVCEGCHMSVALTAP